MRTRPCIFVIVYARINSTFTEAEGDITVGRDLECRINLSEEGISRRQCQYRAGLINCSIYWKDKAWHLEDGFQGHGSTNGTWLDCVCSYGLI